MGVPSSRTAFDPTAEINVTPMIDVMLVLLIIFMVVTPSITAMASLPSAATAVPEKGDRVTLGIDAAGRYFLDEAGARAPIAPAQLEGRLRAAYARRSPDDQVLYLKADQGVPYAHVLTAVEAARQVGVSRIGAITELERTQTRR